MASVGFSVRFSVRFLLGKIFSSGNLTLNPTLNPTLNLTLIYRRGLSSLWRRLKKEARTIELDSSEKSLVYGCAKILAEISGLDRSVTYKRITPRTQDELNSVKSLYEVIKDRSLDDLSEPVTFCTT